MSLSLEELLRDHQRISELSRDLLFKLRLGDLSGSELTDRMAELEGAVRHHLAIEQSIVDHVERDQLSFHLADLWSRSRSEFASIKAEWFRFLDRWNPSAIMNDRSRFEKEAVDFLSGAKDRMAVEVEGFYAGALQTGAITLR